MSERISVSKAVNLLSIKRSEMRERLTAADVDTFEGEVELEQMRCIAPNLKLTDQTILDKVKYLRNYITKTSRDRRKQTIKNLQNEVGKLSAALRVEIQMANHYRDIVADLDQKLSEMQTSRDKAQPRAASLPMDPRQENLWGLRTFSLSWRSLMFSNY